MEKAVKIAYENGWFPTYGGPREVERSILFHGEKFTVSKHQILLDPYFWKALEKGLWGESINDDFNHRAYDILRRDWKSQMHKFIDHVAQGESIDSFFENMLTLKKYKYATNREN